MNLIIIDTFRFNLIAYKTLYEKTDSGYCYYPNHQ